MPLVLMHGEEERQRRDRALAAGLEVELAEALARHHGREAYALGVGLLLVVEVQEGRAALLVRVGGHLLVDRVDAPRELRVALEEEVLAPLLHRAELPLRGLARLARGVRLLGGLLEALLDVLELRLGLEVRPQLVDLHLAERDLTLELLRVAGQRRRAHAPLLLREA